ncbi:MAG: hypothetical protein ACJAYU_005102 [Bradymonadia bacterium]|jgi:hypothetical protein
MSPGSSADSDWVFRNAGGSFVFTGRIVGRVAEVRDGLDNDCDGEVDEGTDPFEDCLDSLEGPAEAWGLLSATRWNGSVELGQTHIVAPNDDRLAPSIIEHRRTGLFFTPDIPTDVSEVRAEVYDGDGGYIGSVPLMNPGSVPVQESAITAAELSYGPDAWFGMLPWDWVVEGNQAVIGYDDGDGSSAAYAHVFADLGAPTRFTITRTKIVLFGEDDYDTATQPATRIARDFFASLPTSQLRWVDSLPWRLDYFVIRSDAGPQRVESEAERVTHTGEDHWSILKHQVALRLSLANTGRGLALTGESDGDSSPYSLGTWIGMGWFRDEAGNYRDIDDAPWAAGWTGWTAMWASECGNGFIHEVGHSMTMAHFTSGAAASWGIADEYPQDGTNVEGHPWGFDTTTDEVRTWFRVDSEGPVMSEGELVGRRDPMNGGEAPNQLSCFPQYTGYHAQKSQNWMTNSPTIMNVSGVPGVYTWDPGSRVFAPSSADEDFGNPVAVDVPTITLIGTLGLGTAVSQTYPPVHTPSGNVFSLPDPSVAGLSDAFDGAQYYLEIEYVDGTETALIAVSEVTDTALRLYSLNLDARREPIEVRLYRSPTAYPSIDFDRSTLVHTRPLSLPEIVYEPIVTVGRGALANGRLELSALCDQGINCDTRDAESMWREGGLALSFSEPGTESIACGEIADWSEFSVPLTGGATAIVRGQRVIRRGEEEVRVALEDATPWLTGPDVEQGVSLWLPFAENSVLDEGTYRSATPLILTATTSEGEFTLVEVVVNLEVIERVPASLDGEFRTPGVLLVGSSANFLVRDPAVGPTSRTWWGTSDPSMLRVRVQGSDGAPHTLNVAAWNTACGSTWQFNAGRGAGDCAHQAVLQVRPADNPTLPRGSYSTYDSAPLVIEARKWHEPDSGGLLDAWGLEVTYNHLPI